MARNINTAAATAAAAMVMLLTACAPTEHADEDRAAVQQELSSSIANAGHEVYGTAGGNASQSVAVRIELPLGRDGLHMAGLCSGADGSVKIMLDGEGPITLSCSVDGEVQALDPVPEVKGNRLLVEATDVPTGTVWAIAATDASWR